MFGHSFILRARDVPLFKTFRTAQNSPNLLFNGSWLPTPLWGMSFSAHCHLVQSLRMNGVMLLLPVFAFMICKGTTLRVSPVSFIETGPLSPLLCHYAVEQTFHIFCGTLRDMISVRNWMCCRIPFWTFSSRCSVDQSASASHPTSTVFRFLFI